MHSFYFLFKTATRFVAVHVHDVVQMYEERATIPLVLFLSIFVGRLGHCIGAGIIFSSTLT